MALALQAVAQNHTVIAGYRNPARSAELLQKAQTHANLHPFVVDVLQTTQLNDLHAYISANFGAKLDILINNAGILVHQQGGINDVALSDITHNFEINVGGPLLTTQALYPLLKAAAESKTINISSGMGSIANSNGGQTPYRISKAALNMLGKNQSLAYAADGVAVMSLHPGWVRTDMGGEGADLSVEVSAEKIWARIHEFSLAQTGAYITLDGETIPF